MEVVGHSGSVRSTTLFAELPFTKKQQASFAAGLPHIRESLGSCCTAHFIVIVAESSQSYSHVCHGCC
eukprot:353502-Chlamydomonas_euryale.AAC.4